MADGVLIFYIYLPDCRGAHHRGYGADGPGFLVEAGDGGLGGGGLPGAGGAHAQAVVEGADVGVGVLGGDDGGDGGGGGEGIGGGRRRRRRRGEEEGGVSEGELGGGGAEDEPEEEEEEEEGEERGGEEEEELPGDQPRPQLVGEPSLGAVPRRRRR